MKRVKILVVTLAVAVVSVISLSAFTTQSQSVVTDVETTHTHATGKHCTGTVGCNCSGFAPITNGDVWQQSYCKHCGHKKSCHK